MKTSILALVLAACAVLGACGDVPRPLGDQSMGWSSSVFGGRDSVGAGQ